MKVSRKVDSIANAAMGTCYFFFLTPHAILLNPSPPPPFPLLISLSSVIHIKKQSSKRIILLLQGYIHRSSLFQTVTTLAMSYNGIGLSTARGSGTNGYVVRNLSTLKYRQRDFKPTDPYDDEPKLRKPNAELVLHEQKRSIEIKCATLQDELEDEG